MIDPTVSAYYVGDCRKLLRQLPDECVQTCITSPPYWGLRDYDTRGQIGLEATPEKYVKVLVAVFEEVWRVLKDDGTLWLNLGDCYANGKLGRSDEDEASLRRRNQHYGTAKAPKAVARGAASGSARRAVGLKPKDLVGIPWAVAFALRDAGWYLRMDNIWSKPNPMPESVTDRTTKSHEYLFHFAKSASYYYNADAIREPQATLGERHVGKAGYRDGHPSKGGITERSLHPLGGNKRSVWEHDEEPARAYRSGNKVRSQRSENGGNRDRNTNQTFGVPWEDEDGRRNKHSVWTVTPVPYSGAHFATFPPALIEPCVLACSRPGDLVLDPFFGSGTTGEVAEKHERRWIGFDISPKYAEIARERTAQRSLPLARHGDAK
jgi:DNA modification methylase